MRIAGKVAANTFSYIDPIVRPGITTLEIDTEITHFITSQGCIPAFQGVRQYPYASCISVNDQVVHCWPGSRVLQDGDIVTIDLGAKYQEFCSDTAKTYLVGSVQPEIQRLVRVGYDSLLAGMKVAVHGKFVTDISKAVSDVIKPHGYGIVKDFVGHGIGKSLHEAPPIPNYVAPGKSPMLTNGMAICIEPILTQDASGEVKPDGSWDILTKHGSLAVHWEHTIAVTPNGPEVLTKRDDEIF